MQASLRQLKDHIIVGAGAGGCAAAKCLSIAQLSQKALWLEQHSEPGGSAGYFSRGQPRRSFEAGATQLIECRDGQLQNTLYSLAPSEYQKHVAQLFEHIPSITQHWPSNSRKVRLLANGSCAWAGDRPATPEELTEIATLEQFLKVSADDAQWMWALMQSIPRFPIQSLSDIVRALKLFSQIPLRKKIELPALMLRSARGMMNKLNIKRHGLADDVISGLLIDTTQSTPEKSPWLAAAMGVSILSRGIFRCRGGMRNYFRPFVSSFEQHGGTYKPNELVTQIATHSEGFLVTTQNVRSGEVSQALATHSLILNLTVWNMISGLIPENDPIRTTRVYKKWQKRCKKERGWGAFAVYALIPDNPSWTDTPQYHQIFPSTDEPPLVQSSLYVSIPARSDPSNPEGFRVLTATLHVDFEQRFTDELKTQITQSLVRRIEEALSTRLSNIESATPSTYARYTRRLHGQVGGFQLSFRNFLFLALPSMVRHPLGQNTRLLVCGDTFFPGQGVIACSVSGIIAFERACRMSFSRLLKQSKVSP